MENAKKIKRISIWLGVLFCLNLVLFALMLPSFSLWSAAVILFQLIIVIYFIGIIIALLKEMDRISNKEKNQP